LFCGKTPTQGVALGWDMSAPSGLKTQKYQLQKVDPGINTKTPFRFLSKRLSGKLEPAQDLVVVQ